MSQGRGNMAAMTSLRLVPRPLAAADACMLDPSQSAALAAARTAKALLVVGAPGTGKTTLTCAAAVAAVTDWGLEPGQVLVLAASRRLAGSLRDQVAAASGRTLGTPMVRTAASAAFALLRTRAAALGEPPPRLQTGPEQDLILADMLAGHLAGEGAPLTLPPGLPLETLGLKGFRQELRDLLMRAAEAGLQPANLAQLGKRHRRPEWVLAAQLFEEYLDLTALRTGTPDAGALFDPAVVVDEASATLRNWEREVPGAERPHWDLVIVDDYQEATAATARFIGQLAADGARLLLLGDPDVAVQGFRGAVPHLIGRAAAPRATDPEVAGAEMAGAEVSSLGAFDATTLTLDTVWRGGPVLRQAVATVTGRISTVGGPLHRLATVANADSSDDSIQVAVFDGRADEAAYIARELRAEHLLRGTPWGQMVVIARSGSHLATLRRDLIAASVPVALLGSDVPLHQEPAVAPLLDVLRVVTGAVLDVSTAVRLLTSPIGGLDAVGLRRLRRALRALELSVGGGRSSDSLLMELLGGSDQIGCLPEPLARAPRTVIAVIEAGRAAAAATGASAETVLWAIWAATSLSERWRDLALRGGPAGVRADRDLDTVLALFRAAETYVDRMPGAPIAAFGKYLESQELAADSLAATGGVESVAALTPAGAAGRSWEFVVVAGVQDGAWPDMRLRDTLLGSAALAELLAGRSDGTELPGSAARAQVLADELRAFALAISRASRRLLVTAVDTEDDTPSVFTDLLHPRDSGDEDPRRVAVKAPLDLRGLIAAARSVLPAAVATEVLADLASAGIEEADPANWNGVVPSCDAPLYAPEAQVPVSPSKVETVVNCPLKWALEAAGGTRADSDRQTLGTLVHKIAETHPRGTLAELRAELDRLWPTLTLTPGWPATAQRKKAERLIEQLAEYISAADEPVGLEVEFDVQIDRARLRGKIDRVEAVGDGKARVVDLKTGSTPPSRGKAVTNPQMGAYQLAIEAGGITGVTTTAGARLVYLGADTKGGAKRDQPTLESDADGNNWAREQVCAAADAMAGKTFAARINEMCTYCDVRRSCPLQPEGRSVASC